MPKVSKKKPLGRGLSSLLGESLNVDNLINTNTKNIFSYSLEFENNKFNNTQFDENKFSNSFGLGLKYRLSQKISVEFVSDSEKINDDIGYLQKKEDKILFGKRNVKSIENSINFEYNIDSRKYLSFRLRNFWSTAYYKDVIFDLLENGKRKIVDDDILSFDPNTNFNLWNLEFNYEWWFSPGSTITIQYKNQRFNRDNKSSLDYYKSLKNLFELPTEHQFSLRINYLIDYNKLRKKK